MVVVSADPPADDGGAEITKYIVELDDGQGELFPPFCFITVLAECEDNDDNNKFVLWRRVTDCNCYGPEILTANLFALFGNTTK